MVQNRNKLIDLFIGNVSNYIVHQILEKAADDEGFAAKYNKELLNSLNIAKQYRDKINPVKVSLPEKDAQYIKSKIIKKVNSELLLRISRGYKGIDMELVNALVEKALEETDII